MGAELIFTGGPVFAGRRNAGGWEVSEAVAVAGERIVAVGRSADVLSLRGPETRVVELHGRTLMAGFNDAHQHLTANGANRLDVNCQALRSIAAVRAGVAERARQQPPGTWIRGWGYNEMGFAEGRHPNRWDLDAVAPDHPVAITRFCYHYAVFNSKALALLGIGDRDADPPGGAYQRVDGVVSGVCREQAWMRHAPVFGHSEEEVLDGVLAASQDLLRMGITSVHDMGGVTGAATLRTLQKAVASGRCKQRVWAVLWSFGDDASFHRHIIESGLCTGFGDERLRLGHLKMILDGAGVPGPKMRQPYFDGPDPDGILHLSPAEFTERVVEAHRAGFACTAHAIGDKAIEIVLDAYAEAQRRYPRPGVRHRIEHCNITPPDLRARLKQLAVIPVTQPILSFPIGDGLVRTYGEEAAVNSRPMRSWLDDGLIPAMSTDCPVWLADPFLNLQAAVTRETGSGAIVPGNEQVTLPEALWMYTYGSAYAEYAEDRKGTLTPGHLADLIVLDRDILQVPAQSIRTVQVDMTVVGGHVLYERV